MAFSNLLRAPLSIGLAVLAVAGAYLRNQRAHVAAPVPPADSHPENASARAAELTRLSRHLLTAGEEEKARIARELHDGLGSTLTAVNLDLFWLQQRLADQPALVGRLVRAREVLATTVEMKRRIMHDLHPTALDTLGLSAALESHAADYSKARAIAIEADLPDDSPALTSGAPIALFRICQEAMANIALRAEVTSIRISLREEHASVILQISDNGLSIDPPNGASGPPPAIGLLSMRERAAAIGGALSIERGVGGRGTVVRVSVPCVETASTPAVSAAKSRVA